MGRIQRIVTSPAVIVLVAFALRLAAMLVDGTYHAPLKMRGWFFAAEMGKVAGLIASGHGFTSPFSGYMGPSAWIGPVYPLLLAGVFKIFGLYTSASAFAILTLNCVFGALTALTIFLIARHIFGREVAIAAAWAWAVLPYAIYWPSHLIWETSLSAFLLSVMFLVTIRMRASVQPLPWAGLGLLWGVMALTNARQCSPCPVPRC
jgi:dolichyl-phosphate-mannose-protein mannosyltransferase